MEITQRLNQRQQEAGGRIAAAVAELERDKNVPERALRILRTGIGPLAKLVTSYHFENGSLDEGWMSELPDSVRALALKIERDIKRYGKRNVIEKWRRRILEEKIPKKIKPF